MRPPCIIFILFLYISQFSTFSLLGQDTHVQGFITMPDGVQLFYKKFGIKGDTLIMLHGGPGQNMYGIGPDLEMMASNNVFIMYDQRGCGYSESGSDTITFKSHINDLESIRKYFGIEELVLVGHSWGAMLSVLYTSTYPQHVKSLLLMSPGPPTRKLFDERFKSFLVKDSVGQARVAQLRAQLNGENALSACREIVAINERFYFADTNNIKKKKGDYCNVPLSAIQKQSSGGLSTLRSLGDYDLAPLCQNVTQPVLLLEGAKSPVPWQEMEYWKKSLKNCMVHIFPNSGHGYPFVEEPEDFRIVVNRFLKGKRQ